MKKKAKKPKYKIIKMTLPQDVADFYRKVAKFSNTTLSQTIMVVVAMKLISEDFIK
jgi:hypothetical protein